jgi:alkylation response protein AidB-like acyl-CoA dehydrogenase
VISFEPTEDQRIAADSVKSFARSVLRPAMRLIEKDSARIDDALKEVGKLGIVQSLASASLAGEALAPRVLSAILLEELAWGDVNTAASFAATLGFVRAVAEGGSERQRRAFLPTYAEDAYRAAAIAAVEPGLRFSLEKTATALTATTRGLRLNGVKTLVPQAVDCRHFLVIAREDSRLVAVVVPCDAPGVMIGDVKETMGVTAQRFRDVIFKDVEITSEHRLGEENACDIQKIVNSSWTATGAILTGLCRAVYEHTVDYTKTRVAHGSALARKQAVAMRLADMFIDVEAMRWMTWRASSHIDEQGDGARSARLAHVFAVKKAGWIADEGVQLMGGHGYIADNPVEAWFRNAKTVSIAQAAFGV